MATQVQLRRGTSTQNDSFTGAQGELTFDTTNKRVRIHDGATTGGFELKTENAGGNTLFADNEKAIFGAGSDLQIYHDGSDSYITDTTGGNFFINDDGAGYLMMKGSDLYFRNTNNEDMIHAQSDGFVKLYHNNSAKLATTATGIDVTGTVTADGLTVEANAPYINISNTGENVGGIKMYDSGGASTQYFNLTYDSGASNTVGFDTGASGEYTFSVNTSEKMRITSSGNVGIGTSSPSQDLEILNGVTGAGIRLAATDAAYWDIERDSASGHLTFTDDAAGTVLTLDQINGNVGIGTSSPSTKLHVNDSSANAYTRVTSSTNTGIDFGQETNGNGLINLRDSAALRVFTGAAERMRIDSSGNVGIGTSSPRVDAGTTTLEVSGSTTARAIIQSTGVGGREYGWYASTAGQFGLYDYTANTERMRIDSSGNLLVGKTSTAIGTVGFRVDGANGFATITRDGYEPLILNRKTSDGDIAKFQKDGTTVGSIGVEGGDLTIGTGDTGVQFGDGGDFIRPFNISTNAPRDNAVDLGVSTTRFKDLYLSEGLRADTLKFRTLAGTERMRLDGAGKVMIGTTTEGQGQADNLTISDSGNMGMTLRSTDSNECSIFFSDATSGAGEYAGSVQYSHGDDALLFGTAGVARMRITSTGNLLVGKTSANPNIAGVAIEADGDAYFTAEGANGRVLYANRLTSNGDIMQFAKDGSTVGAIGASSGNLFLGQGDTTLMFSASADAVNPRGTNGGARDNAIQLGQNSNRFEDAFITNGVTTGSDANDKQDIATLTATEVLVAARLSQTFRTYRWKDAVVSKGDSARTHTGTIAQEVQAAFTAEGLDAGDYALFMSDTWWEIQTEVPAVEAVAEVTDEDGNVTTEAVEAVDAYTHTDTYDTEAEAPEGATSKTRLGIRYPELLSFVAAYNEQRFASIEARLTALEG